MPRFALLAIFSAVALLLGACAKMEQPPAPAAELSDTPPATDAAQQQ